MTECELIDELAKSLAEYDGCIIVATGDLHQFGAWEPRMGPDEQHKTRQEYEQEAGRFLHCFGVAVNLLREQRGFI